MASDSEEGGWTHCWLLTLKRVDRVAAFSEEGDRPHNKIL